MGGSEGFVGRETHSASRLKKKKDGAEKEKKEGKGNRWKSPMGRK